MTISIFETSLQGRELEVLQNFLTVHKLAIICDDNTYKILGKTLYEALKSDLKITLINLGENVRASTTTCNKLKAKLIDIEGVIAVGSGTINDLCKYSSYKLNIPYVIFPTAPSMNGYASINASLEFEGLKQSFSAQTPVAIICDLTIIANAPKRMIFAGFGDSICRSSIQADCYISHMFFNTPYYEKEFAKMQQYESKICNNIDKLIFGDTKYIKTLMQWLIYSGEVMTLAGSSSPASQGEHMLTHLVEMHDYTASNKYLHGEHIAATTIIMRRIQENILNQEAIQIKVNTTSLKKFQEHFSPQLSLKLYNNYQNKCINIDDAQRINIMLTKEWENIRSHLKNVTLSADKIESLTQQPLKNIGLFNHTDYKKHLNHTHLSRDRFTFLDIKAINNSYE